MTPRRSHQDPVAPPPLTRWQSTWRYLLALAISVVAWVEVVDNQWRDQWVVLWLELVAGVAAFVAYHFRRRYPLPIVTGLVALSAVSSLAAGPALLGLVSLATRRLWREILPVAALSVLANSVYVAVQPVGGNQLVWFVVNVLATGVVVAVGMYIGARRELVATVRERAARAESEQALRFARAQADERARIAREMHDVLAHRISLVAMHAGALAYRSDLTPEEREEAASVIQVNAHRALADLREILGVLRERGPGDGPERPQPTLRDLDELIADEVQTGARIRLRNRLQHADKIPESVGRNAYRIVQEGLTNARKHAPNAAVDVVVAGSPGHSLILLVRNPLPVGSVNGTPGAGLGLVGLAERAALVGGRLDHRVTRSGQFVVRAQLPWPA